MVLARLRFSHKITSNLVTMIAVNIDVMIPSDKVTEKPLIGSEPKLYRNNAANKVVRFEPIMVEWHGYSLPQSQQMLTCPALSLL